MPYQLSFWIQMRHFLKTIFEGPSNCVLIEHGGVNYHDTTFFEQRHD